MIAHLLTLMETTSTNGRPTNARLFVCHRLDNVRHFHNRPGRFRNLKKNKNNRRFDLTKQVEIAGTVDNLWISSLRLRYETCPICTDLLGLIVTPPCYNMANNQSKGVGNDDQR
jgi:hypothetical protein